MNILLISTNRSRSPVPVIPAGACMIAEAAAKAGHDVRFVDLMFERDPLDAVRRELYAFTPDLTGLSIRNIDNNDMDTPAFYIDEVALLTGLIRKTVDAPIVIGGASVYVMPEELLRYTGATLAITGDGEEVFTTLLEQMSGGGPLKDIPGISWIENDVFQNNPYPASAERWRCGVPDFNRWIDAKAYFKRMATMPLQSKLGCTFRCIYCTYRKIGGDNYRLGDPEEVSEEVRRLISEGLTHIEFIDNVFNAPYDHALSICERLAEVKHGARLQSLELNPRFLDDPLMSVMERAGFTGLGITVESASDPVLEGLGKGFTSDHVYRSAEVVKRHNIPCLWIFMLGGPNETRATVAETFRFVEKHVRPTDTVFINLGIRIYPGTELESVARRHGLLTAGPEDMLEPVFYLSPQVEYNWLQSRIQSSMDSHMNVISSGSLGLPFLPALHRIGHTLGVRPPLWRHTRFIRRGLRLAGIDA